MLSFRHGDTLLRVTRDNICQFEIKGGSADNIFVTSHLKGGFDDTANTGDDAVTSAIFVEFDNPLAVRQKL